MVKQRSLLGYFGLTFITFGIYGLYWVYAMARDINTVTDDDSGLSPALVLVLSVFTLGIFMIIWMYISSAKMQTAGITKGVQINDSARSIILWMTVGIFIFVGPFIGRYKFIKNYNTLATVYNHQTVKNAA